MKKRVTLPNTDSISALADFFQKHSIADLEGQLVEVADAEFATSNIFRVLLKPKQANALRTLAQEQGIPPEDLIRKWILLHLSTAERNGERTANGSSRRPGPASGKKSKPST